MRQTSVDTGYATTIGLPPIPSRKDTLAIGGQRSNVLVERVGLLGVFLQITVAAFVMRHADLLTPAFRRIVYIAAAAFLAHHVLPMRYRLRAFALPEDAHI